MTPRESVARACKAYKLILALESQAIDVSRPSARGRGWRRWDHLYGSLVVATRIASLDAALLAAGGDHG